MIKPTRMIEQVLPPWKKSFVGQVAEHLNNLVQRGVWESTLPPERALSRQLDVSRPSLRGAIHLLEKEGVLETCQGHPTRIQSRNRKRYDSSTGNKVALLWTHPPAAISRFTLKVIEELRRLMQNRGGSFDLVLDQRLNRKNPSSLLQQHVEQYRLDCWILASVCQPVQKWFQDQNIPAVVMGTTFPGIHLPSVDDDLPAIVRHAVGIFMGLGHQQMLYLVRDYKTAGSLNAERAFLEFNETYPELNCQIQHHCFGPDHTRSCLRKLFSKPNPPTAILVSHSLDALTVLSFAHRIGVAVPQKLSIIVQGGDHFLEYLDPVPAHYDLDAIHRARHICKLISNPQYAKGKIRLFPPFIRGESLAPPAGF